MNRIVLFSVFDDFPFDCLEKLKSVGIHVVCNEKGKERPSGDALKKIIHEYDGIIISTAQKIDEKIMEGVKEKKMIATLSGGVDHICLPKTNNKKVSIINAPVSNRVSVAEHILGLIISLSKSFVSARKISLLGLNKTFLDYKPHDLFAKKIGIIGVGGIGEIVANFCSSFGMEVLGYDIHQKQNLNIKYVDLESLMTKSDIVVLSMPLLDSTRNFIDSSMVNLLKDDCVFVSISRVETFDVQAILSKARKVKTFRVGLDLDAYTTKELWNDSDTNIIITPHIAGGTVESRTRMFEEITQNIIDSSRFFDKKNVD